MTSEKKDQTERNIRAAVNEYIKGGRTLKLFPQRNGFIIFAESNDPSCYHDDETGIREITIEEAKELKDKEECKNREATTIFLQIWEESQIKK
jgi:hypothetical protein